MDYFANYGLFFAKVATSVIALLVLMAGSMVIVLKGKEKSKQKLEIKPLHEKLDEFSETMSEAILSKKEFKKFQKNKKIENKSEKKDKKRIFILNFQGDIRASNLSSFQEEITAVLTIAKPSDEVLVKVESAGGMVHAYGLAASQLDRIKKQNIFLTVAVDKIAASGGYLMACVADKIIAAPFAIIGSIGVVAQIPNFHRLLKKNDIDFEQVTAGEYKRTLTVFGENTESAKKKFQEELNEIHHCFKDFVSEHRRVLEINKVATGEHWLASKAKEFQLVDELMTSEDYLMGASKNCDLYEVSYTQKKSWITKIFQDFRKSLMFF